MKAKHWTMIVPGALLLATGPAGAVELRDAVQSALNTNPEIRQAVANRSATYEERMQAMGAFRPRVDLRASAGIRELRNATRRRLGIGDEVLYPTEAELVLDQLIADAGGRNAELRRQSARVAGAAARVEERSEFVALNVARHYIDYMLQQRLVAIAQDNVTFHERLAGDLREGVSRGSISIADQQQAEERLQAARARVTEAREDLDSAAIAFQTLTGMPIDSVSMPPDLSAYLPGSLAEAEEMARQNNPRVQEALADLAAQREVVRSARSDVGPRLNLEGRARVGNDIDGFEGNARDLQANVVMRWNLMNGGIKEANVREQQGRADEAHARLFEMTRRAEEETRSAWSRLQNQTRLVGELETQQRVADDLLLSYREQFNVGRRSLLDVLDAQNTRYNVQAQTETARLSRLYAQYRLLAATNRLIEALGVQMPVAAVSNEGTRYRYNPIPASDRAETSMPYPVMGPPPPAGSTSMAPAAPLDPGTPPPSAPSEPVGTDPVGTDPAAADPAATTPTEGR